MILRLALGSLRARSLTVIMTIVAIALSVMLFLGVEKVRTGAKSSFADTISGTDLIIGARSGSVQLLLYSVFRIGNATNNVTWQSYLDIAGRPEVEWIVPISLETVIASSGDGYFNGLFLSIIAIARAVHLLLQMAGSWRICSMR